MAAANADRVLEMEWGYIVRKGAKARRRAAIGEMAALAGCMLFGAGAFLQWLAPGSATSAEMLPFKLGATVFLFALSAVLYFVARNGLGQEIHVDTMRGLIRIVRRNQQGEPSLLGSYPFCEVASVFAKRNKAPFMPDHLFMQPRGASDAIEITCGPSKELEQLLERIRADLQARADMAASALERKLAARNDAPQRRVRSVFAAQ